MVHIHPKAINTKWQSYCQHVAWPTITLLGTVGAVYLCNWYLVLTGVYALALGTLVSVICAYLAFTVFHEAAHGNINGSHPELAWLNELSGWLSVFMLAGPYTPAKVIHLHHHAHTNDPVQDPDHWVVASNPVSIALHCFTIFFAYYRSFTVGEVSKTRACQDARTKTIMGISFYILLGGLITWAGFGFEILFLWLVPAIIASGMLAFAFDWLPHHPHASQNSLHDTRILLAPRFEGLLNVALMGQNYHLVHHLWPRVPFYHYGTCFYQVRGYLEQLGAPIETLFSPNHPYNSSPQMAENRVFKQPVEVEKQIFSACVIQKIQETNDTVSLMLQSDAWTGECEPGQYVVLHLDIEGKRVSRCYSISAYLPSSNRFSVTIKAVEGGLASNYLHTLTVGMSLSVSGPLGRFSLKAQNQQATHAVLVGAGSGITPLIAIAEAHLDRGEKNQVTLLYGSRNPSSIIFEQRLYTLQEIYGSRFVVQHSFSQAENKDSGRLEGVRLQNQLKEASARVPSFEVDYYLCGPGKLTVAAKSLLQEQGVSTESIHLETFDAVIPQAALEHSNVSHPVEVTLGNKTYSFNVKESQTILEAALAEDIPLHFACSRGNCGSCVSILTHGSVSQGASQALTERELEAGHILPCISRPSSPCALKSLN